MVSLVRYSCVCCVLPLIGVRIEVCVEFCGGSVGVIKCQGQVEASCTGFRDGDRVALCPAGEYIAVSRATTAVDVLDGLLIAGGVTGDLQCVGSQLGYSCCGEKAAGTAKVPFPPQRSIRTYWVGFGGDGRTHRTGPLCYYRI